MGNMNSSPTLPSLLCNLCPLSRYDRNVEFQVGDIDATFLQTLSLSELIWGDDVLGTRIHRLDIQNLDSDQMQELVREFGVFEPQFFKVETREPRCYQHWPEFLRLTQQCLMYLKMRFCLTSDDAGLNSLHDTMSLFLDFVTLLPKESSFMAHALSVVTCVANRSCCCWFLATDSITENGMITAILDLERKIDLKDKRFFMLCLYSMRAAYGLVAIPEPESRQLAPLFLRYLLKSADSKNGLFEELLPLVSFAIKTNVGPLWKCLQGEVEDFLLRVVRGMRQELDASLYSEFLANAQLFKFEVFLKMFLHEGGYLSVPEIDAAVHNMWRVSRKLGNPEQAYKLVEGVAKDVGILYASLGAEDITELSVRAVELFVILLRIVLFKAKSFLMDLKGKQSLDTLEKEVSYQIVNFEEGLNHFVAIKDELELSENVTSILAYAEEICRSITSSSYSYLAAENMEEVVTNMKTLFPSYLSRMNTILSGMILKCPTLNVPKINVPRLVNLLLEKLQADSCPLSAMKQFNEEIQGTLQSWRPFLTEAADHENFFTQATLVVYQLAYLVDLVEVEGLSQHAWWLYVLIQDMRLVDSEIPANREREMRDSCRDVARVFPPAYRTGKEMDVVSRKEQERDIVDELTLGSKGQYITSIVGMAGIGKTTLAKKVFDDPHVLAHFHRRVWCSVSQMYGKKDFLLAILEDAREQSDLNDLELRLHKLLRQHRYLIVLDDLWDVEALNGLAYIFKDGGRKQSKILITSRNKAALDPKGHAPFSLHPLQEEESWNLLEMKLGFVGTCPDELVEVGKEIARACQGHPLSVVAVAGMLERTERTVESWSKVAENLNTLIMNDPETRCKDILELSYKCLPLHLRECFVYLGACLEERDVSVSKLIRLWIAEGFIEKNGPGKSLEDTAEVYLMDLINRSLVMISRERSNGMVKTCIIHDLLRDFCLLKAGEGNLFQLITVQNEPYVSFDVDYGNELYNHCLTSPVSWHSYGVFVKLKRKHFSDSRPRGQWTRSLKILYGLGNYDVSFIPQHFKLLTVLNMERINLSQGIPSDIGVLVFLTYLAVGGNVDFIPASIGKLRRLETLIVRGSSDEIDLPADIWHLEKLRHLHVKDCAIFKQDGVTGYSSYVLYDLVTFSSLELVSGSENVIRRMPNLRRLSCIFCKSGKSSQFPELGSLTHLESLRIMYSGTSINSAEFILPGNLKKLTLSKFALPWSQIHAISRLQNLEVLKLVCGAFGGEVWDMEKDDVVFPKLKFLMLDSLGIARWVAYSDYLPRLEQLVVKNCKELEKIPEDFSKIDTLVRIEVQCCRESVKQSAFKIQDAFDAVRVIYKLIIPSQELTPQ